MSFTMRPFAGCLLLLPVFTLSACATPGPRALVKDSKSDELRKETYLDVTMPPECTGTTSIPTWEKGLTVSYQEPKTQELAFTTIYLSLPGGQQARAIHVWTNDAHGGAMVTVKNVAAPAQEFALCVTATNWARLESPPALLTPSAR